MKPVELTNLKHICSNIGKVQCDLYSEGAIVALESQNHQSGVKILIDGDFNKQFELNWNYAPNKNGWKEGRDSTHFGAIAIAFFSVIHLTDFTIIEQGIIGNGFDYYLGYKSDDPRYDPDNFLNARLEISGLGKGSPSEISTRIREKTEQTKPSDSWNIPAYISVTAFGKPISFLRKK